MRKTSRSRTPRALARLGLLSLVVVLCAGALFFHTWVAGLFWRTAAPAVEARNSALQRSHGLWGVLYTKEALMQENDWLKTELASTSAALADRDALYQENLDLKQRLGRDGAVPSILAGVVMRPPATPYDTLIIDAGSNQGVAVGDLVSPGGMSYIGTVTEVYPTSARVELFSAPGETYAALLSTGSTAVPVSVTGQGGGSMSAQVPANTPVAIGDRVIFSGVAASLVGVVSSVHQQDGQSFEELYLHLPADPESARFVEVRPSSVAGVVESH